MDQSEPSLVADAEDRPRHTGLEARLADIVFAPLAAMGYDLVRVAVLGREQPTVQIMADCLQSQLQ